MLSQLEPFRLRLRIAVGMPLLHAQEDYEKTAKALLGMAAAGGRE